jgi:hypothetical protein
MLAAIYLVGLANGMGGHFFPHHFVFAVPVFFAVFVVFLRQHVTADARIHVATVVLAVLLSVSCFVPRSDMQLASAVAAEMSRRAAQAQEVAAEIDAVLDRCSIPRYLYLGDVSAGPFAYTRHSPLGPPFLQFQYRFQIDANPWFTHAFEENLQRAEFIVLRSLHTGPWSQIVKETIHDDFTDIPWPCAGEVAPQSPYFFLYRRTEEL